jgi:hypothetical protein
MDSGSSRVEVGRELKRKARGMRYIIIGLIGESSIKHS